MEKDIEKAIEVLKKGGTILYPTDTIWGIGCDATNSKAVQRVYEIKQRAENKAMLVLLGSDENLEKYVSHVPEIAYTLNKLSEKPITIIYDGAYNLAPNLLGENDSVGIRISGEEFSRELCRKFGKPIVSTSANISGTPSPATYAQISETIKKQVDYIVEYRQDDITEKAASSIIKLSSDNTFKIIRH